ncbi:hypothetical protein [uncultured Dysosmobacter sp.]|uniref:hypothetical protein n=1 Tax=uncultured Dysosmobacter sp. TaxID=2591384 RepID=UPI0026381B86|nr:hypothetical protein [uncultured Dysosmobacter sp.]
MIDLHAVWNILLWLFILYLPGLICAAAFIKAAAKRKKTHAVLLGILTIASVAASSLVLHAILDFMLSW